MSRSRWDYTIGKPDDFIQFISNDFFAKEGFRLIDYKGEQVWKKGTGMLVAPSYIKLQYGQGIIHIEAWIKSFGEHSLDGAYGALPKSQLRGRVESLVQLLNQPLPNQAPVAQPVMAGASGPDLSQPGGAQPAYSQQPIVEGPDGSIVNAVDPSIPAPPPPAPVPVAVHNPTGQATLALVMGIIALVGWILMALASIVTGIVGICAAVSGRKSTSRGMATAGMVMSIIGLVLGVATWLLNIFVSLM